MAFQIACSKSRSLLDLVRNTDLVFLMKAQVTRKCVNLHKTFFMNKVKACVGISLQYLICLKSE